MAFLNPLMFFGALAISIPIVIHLLNKRKFERVVWAAMRFLKISIEQNQRRIQLEDLLLLLVRCLILLLLAMAMARPGCKSTAVGGLFGGDKVTAVVAIDNSYSMSQTNGAESRFDRAKKAAIEAIQSLPKGSTVAVLLVSDKADPVIPSPTHDPDLAIKAINEAKLCDRGTDMFQAVDASLDILNKNPGLHKEIYIVTDGQEVGFQDQIGSIRSELESHKADVRCHILLVGEHETKNLGVSGLTMDSDIPGVDRLLPFAVQVTNYGEADETNVRVQLSVDGDAPSAEGTIDNIPKGQSGSIELKTKLRGEGYHTVKATIPPDHLPADDSRTIAVRAVKQVNLLLVDGSPGIESRDSEVFYLRHALTPVGHAEADQYLIKCTTTTVSDIQNHKLEDFDSVVMADVPDLDEKRLQELAVYVRKGHGLFVFPGPRLQNTFYNDVMYHKYGLLPAEIGDARGDAVKQDKWITLQPKGYKEQHPIVSVWGDPDSGSLATAHFFRWYTLKPDSTLELPGQKKTAATRPADEPPPAARSETAEPSAADAGASHIVLNFFDPADAKNNTPAMMIRDWGAGKVVLFASTASTKWNDFADHPNYVPLIFRTLGWILLEEDRVLNVRVGQTFIFHPKLEAMDKDVPIKRPGGADAVRDTRRVETDPDGQPTLSYTDTGMGGAYEVNFGGDTGTVKFAAQPDSSESRLDDLSDAQIAQLSEVAHVVKWTSGAQLKETIEKERVGAEFWLPLAIMAIVLAAAETFLADWFSRTK